MFKYLLIALSVVFVSSCNENLDEEYLVETNDELFPKDYFSLKYFDQNYFEEDSVLITFDDQKRPISKTVKTFFVSTDLVKYIGDSIYEISRNNEIIEKGTYRKKTHYKDILIYKKESTKGNTFTKYDYIELEKDLVLKTKSIYSVSNKDSLIEEHQYNWERNGKYPHLTNLKNIEILYAKDGAIDTISKSKTVLEFSNYDTYNNPFIRLGIFDDINYRNLSFNNYRTLTIKEYDEMGELSFENLYNIFFKYKNGKVDLTK